MVERELQAEIASNVVGRLCVRVCLRVCVCVYYTHWHNKKKITTTTLEEPMQKELQKNDI